MLFLSCRSIGCESWFALNGTIGWYDADPHQSGHLDCNAPDFWSPPKKVVKRIREVLPLNAQTQFRFRKYPHAPWDWNIHLLIVNKLYIFHSWICKYSMTMDHLDYSSICPDTRCTPSSYKWSYNPCMGL